MGSLNAYVERSDAGHTGRYRKPPRYLVTGSFGFGKTLGLHALGDMWAQRDQAVYFFPAANISDRAFVNSAGLLADVMSQIVDDDLASSPLAMSILQDSCKHAFRKSYPLLLIDAIDESRFWHDPQRLAMLWGSIAELGIPAVVTVRDELYESRPLEFDSEGTFFTRLRLTDWDHPLMTQFLDQFAAERGSIPPETFRRFRDVVSTGRYEEHYGDIPRRPLFLSMLAEDAWQGEAPERELYRLYGKYFRAKLQRDWANSTSTNRLVRGEALAQRYGKEEAAEVLIRMMQELAFKLHMRSLEATAPDGLTFPEELLRASASAALGISDRIEDVLLMSLVQPSGRDPVTRQRSYRFAHKSFYDWFLARALIANKRPEASDQLAPTAKTFLAQMEAGIRRGESLP